MGIGIDLKWTDGVFGGGGGNVIALECGIQCTILNLLKKIIKCKLFHNKAVFNKQLQEL